MTGSRVFWALLSVTTAQPYTGEVVEPSDYGPCGLNSFFLVCRLLDVPVEWDEAKTLLGPATEEGTHSFAQIARAAEAVGLYPVGLKADAARLGQLPMPA